MSNTPNMNTTNTNGIDTVNTDTPNQGNASMSTGNPRHTHSTYTHNTLSALVDRTISIIDKGLDRNVGDMNLMQAMEFIGVLMDIRERQRAYERTTSEHVRTGSEKHV